MFCLAFAMCDTEMNMIFEVEDFLLWCNIRLLKRRTSREPSRANNKNREIENDPAYSHTRTLIKMNWNFKQT